MFTKINQLLIIGSFLLIGISPNLSAQILTFNIGTDTADVDSMVIIPIAVDSFTNIVGYQGTIRFDTAALDFVGLSSPRAGISNIFGNPGQGLIPLDAVTFSWIDFSGGSVSLPDSTTVIEISFQVKSNASPGTYPVLVNSTVTTLGYSIGSGILTPLVNQGAVEVQPCVSSSDASFLFPNNICIDAFNPTASITGDLGGVFSVNNGASINPVSGALDLSTTQAGTSYEITYTVGTSCQAISRDTIEVFAVDDASFSITDTVCSNQGNPTPTITGLAGGFFFVNNGATINSSTGELDLSTTQINTSYRVGYQTNGNCPIIAYQNVFVKDSIDVSFAYDTAACPGDFNPLPTITGSMGGVFSIEPAATINAATGELDVATLTLDVAYTVTYSIDDACQISSQQQVLLETDTMLPVVNCQDISVMLDSTGIAVISANMIDAGSSDACGIMSMTVSQDTFMTGGVKEVILTVMDNNGNIETCTAMVTVEWPTSIKDLYSSDISLSMYPNPVQDYLQIEMESPWSGEVGIEILNSMGQTVKQTSMNKQGLELAGQLNLSGLTTGIYMFKVSQNGFVHVKRFLKK